METVYKVVRQSPEGPLTLRGYLDSGHGKDTVAVFCHGLMMHCDINPIKGLASTLADNGTDTLRFDFAGTGSSDGRMSDMAPGTEIADLAAVLSDCRAMGYSRTIVIGHSLGGVIASMTAALHPDLAGALVLLAPAGVVEQDALSGKAAYVEFDPDDVPETIELWGQNLGRQYILECQKLDLFDRISSYKGPVCIVQGDADALVPVSCAERFASALRGSTLHILKNGDHHFIRTMAPASKIVLSFLNSL